MVELGTLKLRPQHGREAEASRGELGRCLAPGYVFDASGHIVKDPNLRVQKAIGLVFGKFNEVASIRQTYRWFHEAEVELPVNNAVGGRFVLAWRLPTMSFVGKVLHDPLYAGAYVYGRRPLNVVFEHGQTRKKQPPTPWRPRTRRSSSHTTMRAILPGTPTSATRPSCAAIAATS